MAEDAFAPLEQAVQTAAGRLRALTEQVQQLRAERDALRDELGRARERMRERVAHDERLQALESERAAVRERIEGLLVRLGEAGIGER